MTVTRSYSCCTAAVSGEFRINFDHLGCIVLLATAQKQHGPFCYLGVLWRAPQFKYTSVIYYRAPIEMRQPQTGIEPASSCSAAERHIFAAWATVAGTNVLRNLTAKLLSNIFYALQKLSWARNSLTSMLICKMSYMFHANESKKQGNERHCNCPCY